MNTVSNGVSAADFYLSVPSAVMRFLESDSSTKTLAKPQLRGTEGQKLELNLGVADKLSQEPGAEMAVNLKFKSMKDFTPEGIANQVPEMRKLLELRSALNALKGPLGNVPGFKKKIQNLLGDQAGRDALMQELGLGDGSKG